MKRLLTIEEAARYLSVSKTSLRRWTNRGHLPCVRIGPRGERRFRREDLDQILSRGREASVADGSRGASAADPMTVLDAAAADGVPRHVSLHYGSPDELWRLFRPYLRHHLGLGRPVLYIHPEGARAEVLERLVGEGFEPDELQARGLLRLLTPSEGYLRSGSFHPERMIDFMESALLDWRARGHSAGLLSGEMSWCLSGAAGCEGMIPYEERLNGLLVRYPEVTIVCHYDVHRLDGSLAIGALRSHPHAQLPDGLVRGLPGPGITAAERLV